MRRSQSQDQQSDTHGYWNGFYETSAERVPSTPTDFARWVAPQLPLDRPILEVGFGTARDSLWFASRGHRVVGYDFAESAESAVRAARSRATSDNVDASFEELDLEDGQACRSVVESWASVECAVFARFLVHSISENARRNLLSMAGGLGSTLYVEFRTAKDAESPHLFGEDHFRIYPNPLEICYEVESRGGSIEHYIEGYGMACYKTEDPHVARIIASWPSPPRN